MAELKLQRVPMPNGGFDTSGAVEDVPTTGRGRMCTDVQLSLHGIIKPRPGITGISDPASVTRSAVVGVWAHKDRYLIVENNVASEWSISNGTQITTYAGPFAGAYSAKSYAVVGDYAYGIMSGGNSEIGSICRWDGAGGIVFQSVAAPRVARSAAYFAGRLFVGGGSVPGTVTPVYQNRLYFTDPGGCPTDNLNEWKDDISGLVNQIVLDGATTITKLIVVDRALYIICPDQILRLTGSGPSNFAVNKVANYGCSNAYQCFQSANGFVFANFAGIYEFDGNVAVRISENAPDVHARFVVGALPNAISAAQMIGQYSGFLLPPLPALYGGPGGTTPDLFIYNHETRAWTKITVPTTFGDGKILVSNSSANSLSVFIFTATGTLQLALDVLPLDIAIGDAFSVGGVATTKSRPMRVQTGVYRLATPQSGSQLHRVMIDYNFKTEFATTPLTLVCNVYKEDGTLVTSINLPEATTDTRQRIVADVFQEVTSVYLEFVTTAQSQADYNTFRQHMTVHDAWLEYSVAAQRRAG